MKLPFCLYANRNSGVPACDQIGVVLQRFHDTVQDWSRGRVGSDNFDQGSFDSNVFYFKKRENKPPLIQIPALSPDGDEPHIRQKPFIDGLPNYGIEVLVNPASGPYGKFSVVDVRDPAKQQIIELTPESYTTTNPGGMFKTPRGTMVFEGFPTDEFVFNESGVDVNFRVESADNANAIFMDAGLNRVGIMNGSPGVTLDVTGTVKGSVEVQTPVVDSAGATDLVLERNNVTRLTVGDTAITGAVKFVAPTLESTVAIGTAPLVVTSTTKVTNLNADQLDGLDSTAFALALSGTQNKLAKFATTTTIGDSEVTDDGSTITLGRDTKVPTLVDPAGTTKKLTLDLSGITAGQTRVLSVPDLAAQTILTRPTATALTANTLPKWTTGGAADSGVSDNGTSIIVGRTNIILGSATADGAQLLKSGGDLYVRDGTAGNNTGSVRSADFHAVTGYYFAANDFSAADLGAERVAAAEVKVTDGSTGYGSLDAGTLKESGTALASKYQGLDAELTALAGLTSAADKVPYFTGSGTAAVADLTSVARTLIAQTTQALMRTTGLGLGTIATEAETAYAKLAGRATGQVLQGGTAASENLTLQSTAHATKGLVVVGDADDMVVDVTNDAVGIGASSPEASSLTVAKNLHHTSGARKVPVDRATMSGNRTLTADSNEYQFLDPNGSDRTVTLPSEVTGQTFVIKHFGGANTITVDWDDATDVQVLSAGQWIRVVYDGTTWQELGSSGLS